MANFINKQRLVESNKRWVRTAKGQSPLPMSTKEIMLPQLGEMSCPTRLALP